MLQFFGDFAQDPQAPADYKATGGTIQLGLSPAMGEAFTPLVDIKLGASGSVAFTVGTADPNFTVAGVSFVSVIQGTPDLPLWSTTGSFRFDANALAGEGVALTSGAKEFAIGAGDFTPNDIRFANPDGPDTGDSQIKLQGVLSVLKLEQPPLNVLSLTVDAGDFVILDSSGVDLTGVSAVTGSLKLGGLGFSAEDLTGCPVIHCHRKLLLDQEVCTTRRRRSPRCGSPTPPT